MFPLAVLTANRKQGGPLGQLLSVCLAVLLLRWGVLVFSWSAGVMYSTLFTMPYLLVAHYHETDTVCLPVLLRSQCPVARMSVNYC
jgi:hypothetical protein